MALRRIGFSIKPLVSLAGFYGASKLWTEYMGLRKNQEIGNRLVVRPLSGVAHDNGFQLYNRQSLLDRYPASPGRPWWMYLSVAIENPTENHIQVTVGEEGFGTQEEVVAEDVIAKDYQFAEPVATQIEMASSEDDVPEFHMEGNIKLAIAEELFGTESQIEALIDDLVVADKILGVQSQIEIGVAKIAANQIKTFIDLAVVEGRLETECHIEAHDEVAVAEEDVIATHFHIREETEISVVEEFGATDVVAEFQTEALVKESSPLHPNNGTEAYRCCYRTMLSEILPHASRTLKLSSRHDAIYSLKVIISEVNETKQERVYTTMGTTASYSRTNISLGQIQNNSIGGINTPNYWANCCKRCDQKVMFSVVRDGICIQYQSGHAPYQDFEVKENGNAQSVPSRLHVNLWNKEPSLLSNMRHPSILSFKLMILDFQDAFLSMAAEFMCDSILSIANQEVDGMMYLQDVGIVHFDLKCSSILTKYSNLAVQKFERPFCSSLEWATEKDIQVEMNPKLGAGLYSLMEPLMMRIEKALFTGASSFKLLKAISNGGHDRLLIDTRVGIFPCSLSFNLEQLAGSPLVITEIDCPLSSCASFSNPHYMALTISAQAKIRSKAFVCGLRDCSKSLPKLSKLKPSRILCKPPTLVDKTLARVSIQCPNYMAPTVSAKAKMRSSAISRESTFGIVKKPSKFGVCRVNKSEGQANYMETTISAKAKVRVFNHGSARDYDCAFVEKKNHHVQSIVAF